MLCKCGHQNETGAVFCSRCGKRLKRRGKIWLILVPVLLLAAALGAGIWFFGEPEEPDREQVWEQDVQTTQPEPEASSGPEPEETPGEETSSREQRDTPEGKPVTDGWHLEDGQYYYSERGQRFTGIRELARETRMDDRVFPAGYYYFDGDGYLRTGWIQYEGALHYFTGEGPAAQPGWYSDAAGWYHLGEMGRLDADTVISENGWDYHLNQDGYLTRKVCPEMTCQEETGQILDIPDLTWLNLPQGVSGCTSVTVAAVMNLQNSQSQDSAGTFGWAAYLRWEGSWQQVNAAFVYDQTARGIRVTFQEPVSFDAICLRPLQVQMQVQDVLRNLTVEY